MGEKQDLLLLWAYYCNTTHPRLAARSIIRFWFRCISLSWSSEKRMHSTYHRCSIEDTTYLTKFKMVKTTTTLLLARTYYWATSLCLVPSTCTYRTDSLYEYFFTITVFKRLAERWLTTPCSNGRFAGGGSRTIVPCNLIRHYFPCGHRNSNSITVFN